MAQGTIGTDEKDRRWAAARARMVYSVNRMARRSVRDFAREARQQIRREKLPVDPWLDSVVAGRSGNHAADFFTRFGALLHTAGRKPHDVRVALIALAVRIADAAHLTHHRA